MTNQEEADAAWRRAQRIHPTLVPDVRAPLLHAEQIAIVCHEANRALQMILGEPISDRTWFEEPDDLRASGIVGVEAALAGAGPRALHESWCETKRRQGWTFGPVKDEVAKTHPCLVPYDDLPFEQQLKDHLFGAIVGALTA